MRLKSEIWVKAYLRGAASQGAPGVVARRGDPDAGVIFIKIARLDGTADLYGPQPAGLASDDGERRWLPIATAEPEEKIEQRLQSELRLDSDIWIVEIEDRQGRNFLEGWLGAS
ncbi:MAG: DUF1491 family protein [Proteobacteria bacterium]|nr:DUF1491 family protein [Pseudomonadota bacterium]